MNNTPEEFYVDVNDVFHSMSEKEKYKMYNLLSEDMEMSNQHSVIEWEFNSNIDKIIVNRLALTNVEDEMIKKIANRF